MPHAYDATDATDSEDARLDAMRVESLAWERDRSDPSDTFNREMKWREGALGCVSDPDEVYRFYEASRSDIVRDRDEEKVYTGRQCELG
jgi:hypothetical protein